MEFEDFGFMVALPLFWRRSAGDGLRLHPFRRFELFQFLGCRSLFFLPRGNLLRLCRLPDLGRLIIAAGDNPLAIRRKGNSQHGATVPLEREHLSAGGSIPQFSRPIPTASQNSFAVRRYGHRPNRRVVPRELPIFGVSLIE